MSLGLLDWLAHVEGAPSLSEPMRLRERLDALDRLELYMESSSDPVLLVRADALRARLEEINSCLYAMLRRDIRAGKNAFALWIEGLEAVPSGCGYDYRDDLVSGVLALDEPDAVAPLPPEMVFYQPTPARHVFELIRCGALTEKDVVMDLGSGLGIVPLLVAIATSARTVGIELEQAYVDAAQRCAQSLDIGRASFECRDVREADFSVATLFYLYTPFTGEVMNHVLAALCQEAQRREIRVATFGPCTTVVAAQRWIKRDGRVSEESLSVFRSR